MRDRGGPGSARTRVDRRLLLLLRLGLGGLGLLSVRLRLLRGDGGGEVRGALGREGRVGLRCVWLRRVGRLSRLSRLAGLREAVAALRREAVPASALRGLGVCLGRQRRAGAGLTGERLLLVRRLGSLRRLGGLKRLRCLRRLAGLREAVAARRLVRRCGTGPLCRGLRRGGARSGRLEGCLLYTS
ncbi:hypothetical protein, partial [Streptomyces sp. rh207]|uniref:hypothetical protein n=1 Tax=Streptomyces sp. rh207 TaxID=2034269 RepID=UPI00211D9783